MTQRFLVLIFIIVAVSAPSMAQEQSDSLTFPYRFNHDFDYASDTLPVFSFQADSLLRHAACHIGTTYVPNGKQPGGFDCSGFTFYNFRRFGIYLPYYSFQQAIVGRSVSVSEARKGDLVIFKGHDLSQEKAGHVGIVARVINGRIQFIHASTSHGVRYDFTDATYFKERFMDIRRIVE